MEVVRSVNGVPIRLTEERWAHIIKARDELEERQEDVLETVEHPDWVTQGYRGSRVAWKGFGKRGFLAVIYKEVSDDDGFIITAFFPRKPTKSKKTWPK